MLLPVANHLSAPEAGTKVASLISMFFSGWGQ